VKGEAMSSRKLLLLLLVPLLGAGAWYGWRWYTTPAPPNISLEGVHKVRAEKVEQALQEVRRQPRSGKTWGELGMTLMANGFFDKSIPCFAQAHRFDPKQARWLYFQGGMMLMFGQRDGFSKLRQSLGLARSATERRAILFALAQALVEDGQLDEAEKRIRELQNLEGDSPGVDFLLGLLAVGRGDRAAARTHLGRLTEHPSARKRAYSLLAGLTDDPQLAQDYRKRSRDLPDDQAWPDSFESELSQFRAEPGTRLATFIELEAQGRSEEALKALQQLVEQSPDEGLCFLLGFTLFKANRFEQAIPAFRQSLGFNPRNPKTHLFLGISLLQFGEIRLREPGGKEKATGLFREAVEAEDKALALQSDIADAHLARGRALKYLGRTDEAIAAFRQAVRVGTEHAEMHQALGEALAEAGQLREGLEHLEDAVKLAKPNDKRPQEALDKWKAKAKSPAPPK
jgi:tetratricopeptide (TPR) repeat protein